MVNIAYYRFSELQEIAIRNISYDVYNTITIVLLFGKVSDIASDYSEISQRQFSTFAQMVSSYLKDYLSSVSSGLAVIQLICLFLNGRSETVLRHIKLQTEKTGSTIE